MRKPHGPPHVFVSSACHRPKALCETLGEGDYNPPGSQGIPWPISEHRHTPSSCLFIRRSSRASGEPARCRRGIEEGLDRPLLAPTTPHSCFHPLLPRKILLLGHPRTRTSGTRRSSSGISLQRSRPLPPCGKSENLWFPSGTEARPPGAGAGPLEHSRPTHAGGEHISPESFPVGVGRRGGQGRWETGRDTCVTRLGGREIEGNRHTGRKMVRGCLSGSMG